MLQEPHVAGGRDKNANEFAKGEILLVLFAKADTSENRWEIFKGAVCFSTGLFRDCTPPPNHLWGFTELLNHCISLLPSGKSESHCFCLREKSAPGLGPNILGTN